MSSFARCLQKAIDLSDFEKIELRKAAAAYREEGYEAADASKGAVKDAIEDLEAKRNSVLMQIKEVVPAKKKPAHEVKPVRTNDVIKLARDIESEPLRLINVNDLWNKASEVDPAMTKTKFNRMIEKLAVSEKITLIPHEKPGILTNIERDELIKINDVFYDSITIPETKKPEQYARRSTKIGDMGVTPDDVQKLFKGQAVGLTPDENIWVKTKFGYGLTIKNVDNIDVDTVAFNIAYGRMDSKNKPIIGKYHDGTIELHRDLAGNWTLGHESYHWMEDIGLVTPEESELVRDEVRRLADNKKWTPVNPADVGRAEDRANFIADNLYNRDAFSPALQKVLNKIYDWIRPFLDMFTGPTAKGLMRDIETGKIFERAKTKPKIEKIEQYAISPQDKEFNLSQGNSKAAQIVSADLTRDGSTWWTKLGDIWKRKQKGLTDAKPDTKAWERILSLPTHYFKKVPALKAILDDGLARVDNYYKLIRHIQDDAAGNSMLKAIQVYAKRNKTEYKKLKNYLIDRDRNQIGYRVMRDLQPDGKNFNIRDLKGKKTEHRFKKEKDAWAYVSALEAQDLIDAGYSQEAAQALMHIRAMTNNGLAVLTNNLRKLIGRYKKAGKPMLKLAVFDGSERVEVDLQAALALMGNMRGYYMPRIRKPGRFTLYAKKEGTNPILENFDSDWAMNTRAAELERKGYSTETRHSRKMPEDVFEIAGSVIALQEHINHALERGRGKYTAAIDKKLSKAKASEAAKKEIASMVPMVEMEFSKAIAELVANNIKARGVRAHMIGRNQAKGKDVWLGYEEDPILAMGKYVRGLASGEAKRKMAFDMLRHFTGTDKPWSQWKAEQIGEIDYKDYLDYVNQKRISAKDQRNAFRDAKNYMGDMLRNDEFMDRFVGMVKGVAVLKYLAGRVSAPLVNLTALVTSVPAAMNGYAKIPIHKTYKLLTRGGVGWTKYSFGNKSEMDEWDRQLYDDIITKGWHEAQYNREALSVLKTKVGAGWDTLIEILMVGFGTTEKLNRVSTIAGSYMGIRDRHEGEWTQADHENALAIGKETSDKAHGVYGKANRPDWARGQNLFARGAQSFYVFKTFSHNYLLTMKELGFKNPVALAYMAISPAVVAGAGASVMTPLIMQMAKAFGLGGDDPEEEFYDWIEANIGETASELARSGIFGAGGKGVSLKGSLAIGVTDLPTSLAELAGAPGSMLYTDPKIALQQIVRGKPLKALERVLPAFLGNILKAHREWTEGLTTNSNTPIFFGKERVQLDWTEMFLRSVSFNPARVAKIREKQWKERKVEQVYSDLRTNLYAKIKDYYLQPQAKKIKEDWLKIIDEIRVYNARVIESGRVIPQITAKSIKNNLRRAFRPPKKERLRK